MAKSFNLTAAQKHVLRNLAGGLILRRAGRGYEFTDENGKFVEKASIAAKSLAGLHLIAYMGTVRGRIYFTTRGYDHWFGGLPTGEQAELCNAADEWVESVKAMFADGAA